MNGFFLSVHGIDGTGKTSAVKRVTELLVDRDVYAVNYDNLKQDNPFTQIKSAVLDLPINVQLAYYTASAVYHSSRIKNLLDTGATVLKSRHLDDIFAHHTYAGADANLLNWAKECPSLVHSDFRVVLVCEEQTRLARLNSRGIKDERDCMVVSPGSRLDFMQQYFRGQPNVLEIDTKRLNLEETAQTIMYHLQKLRGEV